MTDRCNFRCTYCMPKEALDREFRFLPSKELLTFEEIARATRILTGLGVEKVRITGGEPLVRRDVERLVSMLSDLPGSPDLTLTTNGSLLAEKAEALRAAGLARITVSLDSLDDAAFGAMNDVDFPVRRVLDGIDAAKAAGLAPIKVNTVVRRAVNDSSVLDMARHFHGSGVVLRFIEYMDVGTTNDWRMDEVVPAAEILETIAAELPLEPVEPAYRGEVARRYRYRDGGGEVGFIASVTTPFCGDCTRLRLSSEGALYTCLFATSGHDLRALLRGGATDDEIVAFLVEVWSGRADRYSETRTEETRRLAAEGLSKIEMSRLGG